ncbi:uncharacterized protein J3R85_002513 [Psidium guajava]|nr:uncharacterized protein J3R85_002513 [Psidium guajava]
MGIRLLVVTLTNQILRGSVFTEKQAVPMAMGMPKGYFAVPEAEICSSNLSFNQAFISGLAKGSIIR